MEPIATLARIQCEFEENVATSVQCVDKYLTVTGIRWMTDTGWCGELISQFYGAAPGAWTGK